MLWAVYSLSDQLTEFATEFRLALKPFLPVIVGLIILGIADRLFHKRVTELFRGIAKEIKSVIRWRNIVESLNLLGGVLLFLIILLIAAAELTTIIFSAPQIGSVDARMALICCVFFLGLYFILCVALCSKTTGNR